MPDDPDAAKEGHPGHAHGDRWHWRHKIRQNPRQLLVYRFGIGILGLFFILLGFVTGPLPGPGGIPLVLLGLAIWASEFHWAKRLMGWFRKRIHEYRGWTRRQQVLFWVIFALCCWTLGYAVLLVLGIPGWMPDFARDLLTLLPGV